MKRMNNKGITLVKLLITLAIIAVVCGVGIPVTSAIINKSQSSKATQIASSKYQEFVEALRTSCNEDVKDYIVYGVTYSEFWIKTGDHYVLFSNGDIVACNKNVSKIGVLDNIGIFITIGDGIKDKDGNDLKGKSACKLPTVTNGSVICHANDD